MQSKFTFKHLDYSDSLVQYCQQKLEEVGQFLLKDGRCHVMIFKDQHEFVAEISMNTRQKHFKAAGYAIDPYVAVDLMVDKLERQFLKTKDIYMDHKKWKLSKSGKLDDINPQFEYQPKSANKKAA